MFECHCSCGYTSRSNSFKFVAVKFTAGGEYTILFNLGETVIIDYRNNNTFGKWQNSKNI